MHFFSIFTRENTTYLRVRSSRTFQFFSFKKLQKFPHVWFLLWYLASSFTPNETSKHIRMLSLFSSMCIKSDKVVSHLIAFFIKPLFPRTTFFWMYMSKRATYILIYMSSSSLFYGKILRHTTTYSYLKHFSSFMKWNMHVQCISYKAFNKAFATINM